MTVTQLKPDIVVINEKETTLHILELTVPFEHFLESTYFLLTPYLQYILLKYKYFYCPPTAALYV